VLRIYPKCNQKTAIQFLDYLLQKLPFRVDAIQTDNGGEFGTQFHYHVLDRGIRHIYIKPATPRLNGKVERSHRIDTEEFYRMLDGVVIDDTQLFNDKPQEWEDFYNFNRPHSGLDGETPVPTVETKDDNNARLTPGQDQELRARCNPPTSAAQVI
jgi:transposase InsO family protein